MTTYRMPAEWEAHRATWIAWPHEASDWPGKLPAIDWVYADIVRVLSESEPVEILCHDETCYERARECLSLSGVDDARCRLHRFPNDRGWLRDSLPAGVLDPAGALHWIQWQFNAWAKYDNYHQDQKAPAFVSETTGAPLVRAERPDGPQPVVLEGGAIEVDGEGTLLTTEECLLSTVQERNPGLGREGYEQVFRSYLGIEKTIWLGAGCAGDDTHGHIDDIARFVAPGVVLLAFEADPSDANFAASAENLKRLEQAVDAKGRRLQVHLLPMPKAIVFEDLRLPASYANFYIGNKVVIVPTFNDESDRVALDLIAQFFPGRRTIGIHARDLVLGLGTLHCLTQQEPAATR